MGPGWANPYGTSLGTTDFESVSAKSSGLMPSRTHLASTRWPRSSLARGLLRADGEVHRGPLISHFRVGWTWLNYNTTVFVYSRCYALMRRGPDDEQALFLRRDSRHVILGNLTVDTSTELSVSSSQRRTLCSRGLLLYGWPQVWTTRVCRASVDEWRLASAKRIVQAVSLAAAQSKTQTEKQASSCGCRLSGSAVFTFVAIGNDTGVFYKLAAWCWPGPRAGRAGWKSPDSYL